MKNLLVLMIFGIRHPGETTPESYEPTHLPISYINCCRITLRSVKSDI